MSPPQSGLAAEEPGLEQSFSEVVLLNDAFRQRSEERLA